MTSNELWSLDEAALREWLWNRLRLAEPLDPPVDRTHRDEPPEEFVIMAARQADAGFRSRLLSAIRSNLARVSKVYSPPKPGEWTSDRVLDEVIASLAFLISAVEAEELVEDLYWLACPWLARWVREKTEPSAGQFQCLRTLAHLQPGPLLAGFWRQLWEHGPRSLRGLAIFGWARADRDAALRRLAELADDPGVNLPMTIWSLAGRLGPGARAVGAAARALSSDRRARLREALAAVAPPADVLGEFDLASGGPPGADEPPQWLAAIVSLPTKVEMPNWLECPAAAAA